MNQSHNTFDYKDSYISYQSLFSEFNENSFIKLDKKYNDLSIDNKILELFSGFKINDTENQSALHHVYRSAYGNKVGNIDSNTLSKARETIDDCIKLKKSLISKGIKNIVTIGIGGSYEGPKLLIETLTQKHKRTFNHIFITGPDEEEFREEIEPLKKEETFFIVSSKSFSTDETLQSLSLAKHWIGKDLQFSNHFICVTAKINNAKKYGFDKKTSIQFPIEIGGRYSLWSPISLPAILELEHNFYDFLRGGSDADSKLISDIDYKNFIKFVVFSDLWHSNIKNFNTRVILVYSWKLRFLSDYVQQLEMESNGKASNRKSDFIYTGQTIFGGFGSTAQHSYFQLLHQGTSKICADVINIEKDRSNNPLQYAQSIAQSKLLAYGADKNLNEYEKVKGGAPVNLYTLKQLDAFTLGYLISFWEHRVFLNACMLKINPYDQFGVSAGKIFTNEYLDKNVN